MIQRLADEHRLDIRKWSAVSHVVALLYGQLAGCDSLNGIVDAARVHEGEWRNIRGAEPPKRNTFSNANRRRNADMAERLYWEVFGHLVAVCPEFGQYRRHKGFLARMRRGIFAIDSSTIRLCLKGTQADLPDPRLRRLQRERGQVAGLDGAARPPAAALHAARRGLDAQLLAPRGRRARRGVGEARTGRHPQNLWDSTAAQTGRAVRETPAFAGVFRFLAVRLWDSRPVKPNENANRPAPPGKPPTRNLKTDTENPSKSAWVRANCTAYGMLVT